MFTDFQTTVLVLLLLVSVLACVELLVPAISKFRYERSRWKKPKTKTNKKLFRSTF